MKDRMDKAAVGWDEKVELAKHESQKGNQKNTKLFEDNEFGKWIEMRVRENDCIRVLLYSSISDRFPKLLPNLSSFRKSNRVC